MLNKTNEAQIKKILEDANKLLRTKQPSGNFLTNYEFIKLSTADINDALLLFSTKGRHLYISKDDISKVPSFLEDLKNAKTKAEIKKEKKSENIKRQIRKMRPSFNNRMIEIMSFFGASEQVSRENTDLLYVSVVNKIIELQETRLYTLSSKAMNEEINVLLDTVSFSKSISSFIPHDGYILNKLNFLNKNPEELFATNFESSFVAKHREQTGDFIKNFSFKTSVKGESITANVVFKYGSKFIENSNKEELLGLPSLDVSGLKNLKISKDDVNVYVEKIFNRITEDIPLIEQDKLLKRTIFEDFKGKITNVKRHRVKVVFNIDKVGKDLVEMKSQVISAILGDALEIKEKRLAGFKRSFNRKTIQNNIEIEDFKAIFPRARNRNRELIYIQGETNSGKTYTAFEIAKEYESGVYAAPLRLLALEGQQEFKKRGIDCSMLTGEERDEIEGATFVSSTVEMMDYSKEYDVAIIDEVQLINDPDRGHAWLEAIIGVNAKKVILVGSKDIESVIVEIAEYLEEPLEIKHFERKTKLSFDKNLFKRSMNKLGKLPPHSAIIAFSKKDVLDLKTKFENYGNKVSVIYGALPPQVRRIETERFVNGETDVVIGTDAIGMGLNLPIENLFFSKSEKYNGRAIVPVEPALVKQIVGRAGRYKKFETGYVSALSDSVFDFVVTQFNENTEVKEKELKCSPNYAIISQIQELTGDVSVSKLLQNYNNSIRFDFNISNHMNEYSYMFARFLDEMSEERTDHLSLNEKVRLVNAPVSMDRSFKMMDFYKACVKNILTLRDEPEIHPITLVYDNLESLDDSTQSRTELAIKKLDFLSWLSFNFEEFSCLKKEIEIKRKELNKKLVVYLRAVKKEI